MVAGPPKRGISLPPSGWFNFVTVNYLATCVLLRVPSTLWLGLGDKKIDFSQ